MYSVQMVWRRYPCEVTERVDRTPECTWSHEQLLELNDVIDELLPFYATAGDICHCVATNFGLGEQAVPIQGSI